MVLSEELRLRCAEPPQTREACSHTLGELEPVKTMRFDDGSAFTIIGAPIEKNTFQAKLGLRHEIDGVFFDASYNGAFGNLAQSQGFRVDVSFRF